MKIKFYLLYLACSIGLVSCIENEPFNREADIEDFTFKNDTVYSVDIQNDKVQIIISEHADYKKLTPKIQLTPGATITPNPNIPTDFTKDVIYTVTSEDHKYKKQYIVSVTSQISLKYDFNDWETTKGLFKYRRLKDISWDSGNSGIALATMGRKKYYPTRDTILNNTDSTNHSAVMQTLKGGKYFGNLIPIFSGSLFRGKFTVNMGNPIKSAQFGQPHLEKSGRPLYFTGYYQYKAGDKFINAEDQEEEGRKDKASIKAIFFRVTKGKKGESEYITGDSLLTSSKIVAVAIPDATEEISETNKMTKFSYNFTYRDEIDYNKYDYKLGIILASSERGDYYEGALGSMLIIDNIQVVCEKYKEPKEK